jgi:hypothetical protein
MHFYQLKRRDFIIVIGGAAPAWPLAASAQRGTRVTPVKQIRLTERQIQGFIAAQWRWSLNLVSETRGSRPSPKV